MLHNQPSPNVKIGIIGGGWYGCHVGLILKKLGFSVELLEKHDRLFQESSSKNQCRLHLGLHYVRSWSTRKECRIGYDQLIQLYPSSVSPVEENYYVVANKSPIDFRTIIDILKGSEVPFEVVNPKKITIENHQGVVQCNEQYFDHYAAAEYFEKALGKTIQFNCTVSQVDDREDGVTLVTNQGVKEYDLVFDCTYNALGRAQKYVNCYYEPCLTLLYRYIGPREMHPSVTVIDGEFASLYQYAGDVPKVFTLTSVKHTPLGNYATWAENEHRIKTLSTEELAKKRVLFEADIAQFVPTFKEDFGNFNLFRILWLLYVNQDQV